MKFYLSTFFIISILILNFGCAPKATEQVSTNDISSIPDFKPEVPESLGGNQLKNDLKLKALGDIVTFTPENLSDVKSEGWKILCDFISKENWATIFLRALKALSNIKTNFVYNTPIYIGSRTLNVNDKLTNINLGSIIIKKISDNYKEIYWTIPLNYSIFGTQYNYNIYIFITISNVNNNTKITMQLKSDIGYALAKLLNIDTNKLITFGSFDQSKGEIIEFAMWSDNTYYYNQSKKNSNGDITIFSKGIFLGLITNSVIAYGNNNIGGLIANYKSILGNNIHSEFYNSYGNLVYKNFGIEGIDKVSNIINILWFGFVLLGKNIKDYNFTNAIDSLVIKAEGNPKKYIFTNGVGNLETNNTFYPVLYFKNGNSWNSGDAIYLIKDINKISDTLSYINYVRADIIPSPKDYFGGQYYIQNHWPIKYLQLDNEYSNYQLVRKEEQTHTLTNTWTDPNDEKIIYTNTFSWIDYTWWLDKDKDNILTNMIDIQLHNIYQDDVWLWTKTDNRKPIKQKSWFLKSAENKPLYFNFTQQSIIDNVNSQIINFYDNEVKNFSIDNFINSIPKFPSLNEFPSPTKKENMMEL